MRRIRVIVALHLQTLQKRHAQYRQRPRLFDEVVLDAADFRRLEDAAPFEVVGADCVAASSTASATPPSPPTFGRRGAGSYGRRKWWRRVHVHTLQMQRDE